MTEIPPIPIWWILKDIDRLKALVRVTDGDQRAAFERDYKFLQALLMHWETSSENPKNEEPAFIGTR